MILPCILNAGWQLHMCVWMWLCPLPSFLIRITTPAKRRGEQLSSLSFRVVRSSFMEWNDAIRRESLPPVRAPFPAELVGQLIDPGGAERSRAEQSGVERSQKTGLRAKILTSLKDMLLVYLASL
jgi:hypothetical protein